MLGVLLIIARILGRRTLAQLTFFDFVVGIVLGNIAASIVLDKTANIPEIMASLVTTAFWVIAISFLSMKSLSGRKLLEAQPMVIIYKGKILEDNLSKRYYNVNDLLELLREQEIFSPSEVEIALIETDGALSVLKKPQQQTANSDGNQSQGTDNNVALSKMVGKELIIDGKVILENLKLAGITEADIMEQLALQGIERVEDVTLGLLTPSGEFYFDQKKDDIDK